MTPTGSGKPTSIKRLSGYIISAVLLAGLLLFLGWSGDLPTVVRQLGRLSAANVILIFAALLVNAFGAALRLKVVSGQLGHPLRFREAIGTVGASSIAGALFFQIAGQLAARGALMGRKAVPFESVVVITLFERIVAAVFSFVLALAAAYFIFGQVLFDQKAGGADLLKLILGLLAVVGSGALFSYGRFAAAKIQPSIIGRFPAILGAALLVTALVQISMMTAYVLAVHELAQGISIDKLTAASCLVMFAASIPISLAGWGVREMSAVAALGAIGVGAPEAFTAAILVGFGSLLAMGVLCAVGLPFALKRRSPSGTDRQIAAGRGQLDAGASLQWGIPIGAAMLVFFQIHIPTASMTLLNVNLADPVAILGGVLFVIEAVRGGTLPEWRFRPFMIAFAVMSLVLTISLLHGAAEFGWTPWAVTNRYLGWFVLWSYVGCGALIVHAGRERGLRMFLRTFVAAGCAVALLELICLLMVTLDVPILPVAVGQIQGFAQNRNAFAFQLLIAMAAALVVASGRWRTVALAVLSSALYFAGSRSGWITTAALIGMALWLRSIGIKQLAVAAVGSALLVGVILLAGFFANSDAGLLPSFHQTASEADERMRSIIGGFDLFRAHPLFGAGLGAFRSQFIRTAENLPLVIHSGYVWLLAELGIVGFLAFIVPAAAILWQEMRRQARDRASNVVILCMVVFALMSMPADMVYQRTFWLLFGAALAVIPAKLEFPARVSSSTAGAVAVPPA